MNIQIDVLEQLMPNLLTMITQLVATFLLFVLMKKLAWEPAKKMLQQRADYQQSLLTEAEELKKENERLRRQVERQLAEADKAAQQTLANAQIEGEKLKNELVNEGREKSKQIVEEAQADIEMQKARMLDEMHEELVDAAISATEKMLNSKLDEKKDHQVIDDFIKEVSGK